MARKRPHKGYKGGVGRVGRSPKPRGFCKIQPHQRGKILRRIARDLKKHDEWAVVRAGFTVCARTGKLPPWETCICESCTGARTAERILRELVSSMEFRMDMLDRSRGKKYAKHWQESLEK